MEPFSSMLESKMREAIAAKKQLIISVIDSAKISPGIKTKKNILHDLKREVIEKKNLTPPQFINERPIPIVNN